MPPLYFDDFEPLALPHAYMQALMDMGRAIGDEPVNPGTALKLLRAFIRPLVPDQYRQAFDLDGHASWERIHMLYPQLAFAGQGKDKALLAAATVVDRLVRHTTRPARDFEFPKFLEVSSFTRISKILRLPVANPSVGVGARELRLYEFCKFCWQPARSYRVCQYHSTKQEDTQGALSPACAGATLKQVQRLRESFDRHVAQIVSAEEWEFHGSEFGAPVLLPASGLLAWLHERRPVLAQAVQDPTYAAEDAALMKMLSVLYGDAAGAVASAIGGAVHLLTPVTARAEAWLTAWQTRPRWGGARRGARRRELPAGDASIVSLSLVIIDLPDLAMKTAPSRRETYDGVRELLCGVARRWGLTCDDLSLSESLTLLEPQFAKWCMNATCEVPTGEGLSDGDLVRLARKFLDSLAVRVCVASNDSFSNLEPWLEQVGLLPDSAGELLRIRGAVPPHSKSELFARVAIALCIDPTHCLIVSETMLATSDPNGDGIHGFVLRRTAAHAPWVAVEVELADGVSIAKPRPGAQIASPSDS